MKTRASADGGSAASVPGPPSARVASRRRPAPLGPDGRDGTGPFGPPSLAPPFFLADPGPLVGREEHLERLLALWQQCREGIAGLALVGGEAGVGKTRLVAELAGQAGCEGAVMVGRCAQAIERPYGPLIDALAPVVSRRSDPWLEPGTISRSHLLRGVAAALAGTEGSEPLLLVVEDLHWATRSTVLVLEHLAREQPAAALLVVGTYRDDAIHPSHPLAQLLDGPVAGPSQRMILPRLELEEVTALLEQRAGCSPRAAGPLAGDLWRATEGVPLVLTEFMADLLASGVLVEGIVPPDQSDRVVIPHDVSGLVARRMGGVPSATRTALEAAAVIGPSFSVELLSRLTERREPDLLPTLDRAVAHRLVARVDEQPGEYRFLHDLVHDAVYSATPPNRKVRLHHQMATLIQDDEGEGSLAALVRHLVAACPVGRSPDAVAPCQRAAAAAMAVLAFEEAAGFYGRALAFLGSDGDPAVRADLLIALGDANHRAAEAARARQAYLQAATVARASQDGPRLGRAVLGLGEVAGTWGADGLLISLLEQALAANPAEGADPGLRAKLLARLAQARAGRAGPDQRKADSDHAWELAWESADADTMGAVLRSRHEALCSPDDLEDRIEVDGELVAMAAAAKDEPLAMVAHGWRVVDLLEHGDLCDADRDRERHAHLARKLGDLPHLRQAAVWAAMRDLLAGRTGPARAQIDKAFALGQKLQHPQAAPTFWIQQLELNLAWGDASELEDLAEKWRNPLRNVELDPTWRSSLALLLANIGRREEAAEELDDLLMGHGSHLALDRAWLPAMAAAGEVVALLGDDRATHLAKLLAPYSRRLVVVGDAMVCRGSVARVLGLLCAVGGTWSEAERHFQAALSAHEHLGCGPLMARTRGEFALAMARHPGGPLHLGRTQVTLADAAQEALRFQLTRLEAELRAAVDKLATERVPAGQPSGTGTPRR